MKDLDDMDVESVTMLHEQDDKLGIELLQEWNISQKSPIEAYEAMTRMAQEAERLGFHSIWLFDHVHLPALSQPTEQMIFECWMSIAALEQHGVQEVIISRRSILSNESLNLIAQCIN